jgi:hypothetical protein
MHSGKLNTMSYFPSVHITGEIIVTDLQIFNGFTQSRYNQVHEKVLTHMTYFTLDWLCTTTYKYTITIG